jgi:hypothetical protein
MIKSVVAKLLTVKVAALTVAVVGVGGVALAASTNNLPGESSGGGASASHSPDHDKDRPSTGSSGQPSDRSDRAAVPSGLPPGLYWLCNDYIGRDAEHRGKALGESKFHELAAQAGNNRDKADKFCDKLLEDRSGGPAATPSRGPNPNSTKAGQRPSRVTGQPTDRPSGASTPHPDR